jgi:hypothetical protein
MLHSPYSGAGLVFEEGENQEQVKYQAALQRHPDIFRLAGVRVEITARQHAADLILRVYLVGPYSGAGLVFEEGENQEQVKYQAAHHELVASALATSRHLPACRSKGRNYRPPACSRPDFAGLSRGRFLSNQEQVKYQAAHHELVASALATKIAHEINPQNQVGCISPSSNTRPAPE